MPIAVAAVTVEYELLLQSVHAILPMTALYFPAAHALHVPPSGPVYPGLQTQLVKALDPALDCVNEGQF